jgi:hypothetical protein
MRSGGSVGVSGDLEERKWYGRGTILKIKIFVVA